MPLKTNYRNLIANELIPLFKKCLIIIWSIGKNPLSLPYNELIDRATAGGRHTSLSPAAHQIVN